MQTVGYIRTTITENDAKEQQSKLAAYGCTEFFHEDSQKEQSISLDDVLKKMNSGDTLVVDRLFHLGKSTRQLSEWMLHLQELQINFVCLTEKIDTREPEGKLYVQLMGQMAEMEKELLKERTLLGLSKAREKGKVGGDQKSRQKQFRKFGFSSLKRKNPSKQLPILVKFPSALAISISI